MHFIMTNFLLRGNHNNFKYNKVVGAMIENRYIITFLNVCISLKNELNLLRFTVYLDWFSN